jgi:hypothetical protein
MIKFDLKRPFFSFALILAGSTHCRATGPNEIVVAVVCDQTAIAINTGDNIFTKRTGIGRWAYI